MTKIEGEIVKHMGKSLPLLCSRYPQTKKKQKVAKRILKTQEPHQPK